MKNTRYLAAGFGVAGIFALLVTVAMNRAFGVSAASTTEGAQLLSTAAIVIDVAGLVLFGIAAGALLRQGQRAGAALCFTIMLAAGGFSMMSIVSFVASEQKGLEYARKAEEKRKADAEQAQRTAQKEVRDTQARMAEQHMKWLQGTVKEADGRRERKDMLEAAKKVITEVGQQQMASVPKAEVPKEEVKARPDSGTELLATFTGIDYSTVQVLRMVYFGALLLIIKSFAFPLLAYFWSPQEAKVIDLEPEDPRSAVLTEVKPALAAPRLLALGKPADTPKPAFPPRPEPGSDAKRLLEAIDFAPPYYRGPERDKDARDHVAWRFLAWVTAHGLGGEHNNEKMDSMLDEFAATDHRPAWASRVVKAELQSLGKGFATTKQASVPRADGGRDRATHWVIVPPTIPKLMALLEKNKVVVAKPTAATKEAATVIRPPFGNAAGDAPDATPAAAPKAKGMSRFVPDIAGMQALVRQQKRDWQQRFASRDRKQANRMRRSRAA